jgi:integrase/recombinase XerD
MGTRVTTRNLGRELKAIGRKLGISGVRFSAHTLSHTFVVNYLRNSGNVFYLQRILGHSTLEMTNRYVRSLGIEDLQKVHNRLSLLSKT